MTTALLIMLREGFEGALVVAIVFAYLRRIGRMDLGRATWLGVGAAAAISLGVGVVVHTWTDGLEGVARIRTFAAISLAALGVLTWMVFWMKRQARAIKGELEHSIDAAIHAGEHVGRAVALVAFFAVLREGIEAALFLIAAATEAGGQEVLVGGVIGLAIACVFAGMVYAGGRTLPMKQFFTISGVVLIVFAAGLLARSVLYLQATGDLSSANDAVYDLTQYRWLTQETEVGKFLAAMFGWDPRPSIEQVVAWLGYFVVVTTLFLRPARAARPVKVDATAPSVGA